MDISEEQQQFERDTMAALGGYVMAFSNVMLSLHWGTIHLMGMLDAGRNQTLAEAALEGRTAEPTIKAFFALLHVRYQDQVSNADLSIIDALRKEVDELPLDGRPTDGRLGGRPVHEISLTRS